MLAWIGLIFLAVCGVALIAIGSPAEQFGVNDEALAHIIRGTALTLVIGGSLLFSYRGNAGLAFKQAAVWVAIGLGLVSLYSYRADLLRFGQRIAGELVPGVPVSVETETAADGSSRKVVAIRATDSGHFNVETLVNGTHVTMLADTGATMVTLTNTDAHRIGIEVNSLSYTVRMRTANGVTHAALVDLDEIAVGGILVRKVAALVSQPDILDHSLLGMTFFKEIGSFEMSGDRLVLRE